MRGSPIQTVSGKLFYPLDPQIDLIDIYDIAHALSNICRFCGHTKKFYSVAQHSVYVSEHCGSKNALWGLLHDASEAYIADVATPVKKLPELNRYRDIETGIMAAVCQRFGLALEMPPDVVAADRKLLITEARDLMGVPPGSWPKYQDGAIGGLVIEAMDPDRARTSFIARFRELTLNGD